jgi:D-proline reductase (dithiol) PrdB
MARLERLTASERDSILSLPCPTFETEPFQAGPPLARRRIAIVSTAGLHLRGDRPFELSTRLDDLDGDFRVIPGEVEAGELLMSHVSVNFDRAGFQQDWNVVFPLDRLRELAGAGIVGSLARFHYSFMGAAPPERLAGPARRLARLLHADAVDGALLVPV